ncbi:MAG: DUF3836 domain-containing protein [Draconibacterium sp.]|nr:DUF3836 domain-containing protein [Draconibacterium sp.]
MKKVFTFTILLLSITVMSFAHSWNPEKMKPDDFKNILLKVQKINQFNHLKSAEVDKQRLDSIVAETGAKYAYTYDSNGNLILDVTYSRDGNVWKGDSKIEYSYDSNGMMIQEKDYEWDDDKNDWEPISIIDLIYDSNQRPIELIMTQWDPDLNKWKKLFKSDVTYNANGSQQQIVFFMWDGVSEWTEAGGAEMTYDANGNLTEEISDLFGMKR